MTYPYAYQGIKRLHVAEILMIIGTIIGSVGSYIFSEDGLNLNADSLNIVIFAIIVIVILIGDILVLIADVLNIIGLWTASKDVKLFILPFVLSFAMIASKIVLRVVFYAEHSESVNEILELVEDVVELTQMICVIVICRRIARELHNPKIITFSNRLIYYVYFDVVLSIAISLMIVFNISSVAYIYFFSGLLDIVAFVFYLVYVDKAIEFLKEN